jgi:hypothetical protein
VWAGAVVLALVGADGPWFQQYEPRTDHHRSRD